MPWDPERYELFQSERSAPFYDLLELVEVRPGLDVLDLGCGTGELTSKLAERLPYSDVLGIDSSAEMLTKSESFAGNSLRFQQQRIEEVGGEWDLIFSNAALHWLENHVELIPRLFALLRPGGQIAIQMPNNFGHFSHLLILEIASSSPFRGALHGWTRTPPVLSTERYAEILFDEGAERINVFEKIYAHVLENAESIADSTSGTALVPYFERLPEELKPQFMENYRAGLRKQFPQSPVLYPFKRILFSALQPES